MNERYLKEDIFRILRLLSLQDDLSQRDLSGHLGISLGKTNYLLKALVQKGFVKIMDFAAGDKKLLKAKYILTPKGIEEKVRLAYYYLKLKEKEYFALKKDVEENALSPEFNVG